MTTPLGSYSFLPALRSGLARRVTSADQDATVKTRAKVNVTIEVRSDSGATKTVDRDVELFGPGDIIGIDERVWVRTEPRRAVSNFEPNYLQCIECYDEDFPWRYTPAGPDASNRLRPWIALVVLKEDEFTQGEATDTRPLPFIRVPNASALPPFDDLWAWAHVHVNRNIAADAETVSTDMAAVLGRLEGVLAEDRDLAYSRIICPRKLEGGQAYHAFVVPVFETGRLAGLGLDPAVAPFATFSAWASYTAGTKPEANSYPYYYRFFFRTGTIGDFEYLVRQLEAKPVSARVGTRDMDVQAPGAGLPGITDARLHGVLALGGALRAPAAARTPDEAATAAMYEQWAEPYPHQFQRSLAQYVNLADDYASQPPASANAGTTLGADIENDPDPVITPPLYGRWHALVQRVLTAGDGSALPNSRNWVHELNLDPRFRVAAGFGTSVIRERQEELMSAAWAQVGDILEANRRIRAAQLSMTVSLAWYDATVLPMVVTDPAHTMLLTAPVQARVVDGGKTVRARVDASVVSKAVTSAPMRRLLRPSARLARLTNTALSEQDRSGSTPATEGRLAGRVLEGINARELTAAPPKVAPPGVVTVDDVADQLMLRSGIPRWLRALLRRPWVFWLLLVVLALLLVLLLGPVGIALAVMAIVAALAFARRLAQWHAAIVARDAIREDNQGAGAADGLPLPPGFTITAPGVPPPTGGTSTTVGERFRSALADVGTMLTASSTVARLTPRAPLDVAATARVMADAILPSRTIPARTMSSVVIPERIAQAMAQPETFQEAMAYPQFDTPMFRPLMDISTELFLPNIGLIEPDSITLLETNQRFIEAYMVGLNHEFARELLWREYPTDQRGSYFRQFWDPGAYLAAPNADPEALRESLRDIPPLHHWSRSSRLGEHDQRAANGTKEDEVVLVIRGELMRKYPTAVIYAHRAAWVRKPDGSIDLTQPRTLVALTAEEQAAPPRTKVKTPLYEAKAEPDIYFFGFDLSVSAAKGGTGEQPGDDPGWFLVLKERPGEPRFGFDLERSGALEIWSDASWDDVMPGGVAGAYLRVGGATPALTAPAPASPKRQQYDEDHQVPWGTTASAADVAYVLYQSPVLVAIHAAEMLGAP